jgi:hypothetical protein
MRSNTGNTRNSSSIVCQGELALLSACRNSLLLCSGVLWCCLCMCSSEPVSLFIGQGGHALAKCGAWQLWFKLVPYTCLPAFGQESMPRFAVA